MGLIGRELSTYVLRCVGLDNYGWPNEFSPGFDGYGWRNEFRPTGLVRYFCLSVMLLRNRLLLAFITNKYGL